MGGRPVWSSQPGGACSKQLYSRRGGGMRGKKGPIKKGRPAACLLHAVGQPFGVLRRMGPLCERVGLWGQPPAQSSFLIPKISRSSPARHRGLFTTITCTVHPFPSRSRGLGRSGQGFCAGPPFGGGLGWARPAASIPFYPAGGQKVQVFFAKSFQRACPPARDRAARRVVKGRSFPHNGRTE